MTERGRAGLAVFLGALAAACGGTANLGDDSDADPESGVWGRSADPGSTPDRELVYQPPKAQVGIASLTGAGEHLYISVFDLGTEHHGLLRCKKRDCSATQVSLAVPSTLFVSELSATSGRLGMTLSVDRAEAGLSTCALPDCTDPVVYKGLRPNVMGVRFESDQVEWSQAEDDSVYRCSLPGCSAGPELVVRGISASQVLKSEDLTIYREGAQVFRVTSEPGSLEMLELGERLSGGSPVFDLRPGESGSNPVEQLALEDGWLYALERDGCDGATPACSVARWPAHGYGAREVVFRHERGIYRMELFDGELAMVVSDDDASAALSTCRVEDCTDTWRLLPTRGLPQNLVADGERLYWTELFQGAPEQQSQIRSAPRLDAP